MKCIGYQHSEQNCYCGDGVFVRLLNCINSDKFILSNENHEMYQI